MPNSTCTFLKDLRSWGFARDWLFHIYYDSRCPFYRFTCLCWIFQFLNWSVLLSSFYLILFILQKCLLAIYDFNSFLKNCLCSKAELHFQVNRYEGSQRIEHHVGWSEARSPAPVSPAPSPGNLGWSSPCLLRHLGPEWSQLSHSFLKESI